MHGYRAMVLVGACALALGCGGAPLPGAPGAGGPGGGAADGGDRQEANTSYYPISPGSSWTYRITPEEGEVFEKQIEIVETAPVPNGSGMTATLAVSVQPHLTEESWMVERDGIVYRVWEKDFRDGVLLRTTSWSPSIVKSLSALRPVSWAESFDTLETIELPAGDVEERDRTFVWRVLGTESVTVPAGTFPEAMKVERLRPDNPDYHRVYWLVPGVGKVKETGPRLEELIRYEVMPDAD